MASRTPAGRRLAVAAGCLGAVFLAGAAAGAESTYSAIDWQDGCTVIDRPAAGEPGAWARLRCEGLPGYPVLVSDDDQRMSLDYGPVEEPGPWESFAGFNRVHDTVEWRRRAGGPPYATIQRWFVSGGPQGERQVLVVSTVARGESPDSCVAGMVDVAAEGADANRTARRVADTVARGFGCGVDEARYHGAVSADAPRFSPAPREPARVDAAGETGGEAQGPEAMLRDYWSALRRADDGQALARYRLGGTAHTPARFAQLQDLAGRFAIDSVEPLVASDAERRLGVTLVSRSGGERRSAEVGMVRIDGDWRIAMERW